MLVSPIGPTLIRLAAPNILSMLVLLVTLVLEAWFIGQLGTIPLAGLALAFPMFMLMMMLSAGSIGGAITGAVAKKIGAGDIREAQELALHSLLLSLFLAFISSLIFLLAGKWIYTVLGGRGLVLEQALLYSDFFFFGCFSMWLSTALAAIVRATGNMKVAATGVIAGFIVQALFSAIFIFGLGPIPSLGITGAAVGAVLGFSTAAIIHLYFLSHSCKELPLIFKGIQINLLPIMNILRVGGLSAVNPFCSWATVVLIGAFMADYGVDVLAGYGIGSRLEFLLIPLIFGFGAASTVMVGTHFGADEIDRAHKVGWTAALYSGGVAGLIGLVVAFFPQLWANLFSDVETVRVACGTYLKIAGPFYAFFALGLCLYFASQGAGRVFWPVLAVALRFAIVLCGAIAVSRMQQPSIELFFIFIALGMVVQGLLTGLSIYLGAWKPKKK